MLCFPSMCPLTSKFVKLNDSFVPHKGFSAAVPALWRQLSRGSRSESLQAGTGSRPQSASWCWGDIEHAGFVLLFLLHRHSLVILCQFVGGVWSASWLEEEGLGVRLGVGLARDVKLVGERERNFSLAHQLLVGVVGRKWVLTCGSQELIGRGDAGRFHNSLTELIS